MTTIEAWTNPASDVDDARTEHRWMARARRVRDELWGDNFPLYLPSLVSIGFGLVLALPADTFPSSPSFRVMAKLGEPACAAICIVVGVAHVGMLYARSQHCYLIRGVVQAMWVLVAGSFATSYVATTGIVAYAGYALLAFWGRHRVHRRSE